MYLKTILICAFLISHTLTDVDGKRSWGGSSNSRKSGGGLFSRSKTTPRPRTQHQTPHSGGSEPGKIGWNVPQKDKGTSSNTAPKPSAPQSEVISKTSATNSQSGYQPSGGYSHNQPSGNPPPYSSHPAGNPPPYSSHPVGNPPPPYSSHNSYNPSVGGGYHAPPSYSPPGGGYNPPVGGGYNPSYGYHGGAPMGGGSFAQPQTIYVQSAGQPSRSPGIGQLAKEAVVYAGVSAGVNAAVNRIIPGGIYGTRGSSSESHVVGGGAPTYTSITNNYYNGSAPSPAEGGAPAAPAAPAAAAAPAPGAAAPAPVAAAAAAPAAETPQNAQSNPQTDAAAATTNQKDGTQQAANNNNLNPLGYVISDDDIKKFTEDLFGKDKNNAFSHITVKLQGQKKDDSTTDDAPEPLLEVKPEAYEIPTIKAVLPLHNNYELDVKTKEEVTSEKRQEESELLDKFLDTEVFKTTMKFLANKGYVPDDEYEFKDTLKRMWFSKFKRTDAEASSCGFEAVFLAEKFDNEIIGLHNWIYYAQQEANKNMNYLGYIKEVSLGDKGKVLKVRSTLNGITQPVTSIFVGTSPELEMALYTMCFFTRPGAVCPMSLGGTEFVIIVNRVNYFGKDILISAYPEI